MQIELFNPTTNMDDGIVVFPARFATAETDGGTKFHYKNNIGIGQNFARIISCTFDKKSNRARIIADIVPVERSQNQAVTACADAVVRNCFEAKLNIPRGSLSPQRVCCYKITNAPGYWGDRPGTMIASDNTVVEITADSMRKRIYKQLLNWLEAIYKEHGCPEEVDRMRLPDALKSYTAELRQQWRIDQHNFIYPANALATLLADSLTDRRCSTYTLDQLIDWKLIPDYPTITVASARATVWDTLRATEFVGVYVLPAKRNALVAVGESSNAVTKNTQLACKVSRLLNTQVSLQELDQAFDAFNKSLAGISKQSVPQLFLSGRRNVSLFMVGVVKTTNKE